MNFTKNPRIGSTIRYLSLSVVLTAVYIVLALLSLRFTKIPGSTSAFWIPTGFSIALLILMGLRYSPVLILGKILYGLTKETTFAEILISSFASYTEAYIGFYLFHSFKKTIEDHFEYQSVLVKISMIAFLSPILCAMIGVTSLLYFGRIDETDYFSHLFTWYVGDVLTAFIFLPAFLYNKLVPENDEISARHWSDFLSPMLAVLFTLLFSFTELNPFIFALFLAVLIPVLFGGGRGMFYSVIGITLTLNWMQLVHQGPFSVGDYDENLISLQFFLYSIAITALAIEGFRCSGIIKSMVFTLLTFWLLSGSVYYYYHTQKDFNDNKNLTATISEFGNHLKERMIFFRNAIQGVAGFVAASEKVSPNEWNNYLESISFIDSQWGIRSLALIFPDQEPKNDLFKFRVNEKKFLFLKDREVLNLPAIQRAMQAALVKQDIVMTEPIEVNVNNNAMKLTFFVMPVFKNHKLLAWLISSFELSRVIHSMVDNDFENIDIDVYYGKDSSKKEMLVFQKIIDPRFRYNYQGKARLSLIDISGQFLTVNWHQTARFISLHSSLNSLFILLGSIFSLVCTGFFINLRLINEKANRLASIKTRELSESEEKFRSLFNHSSDAVILFDDKKILDCNPESLQIFGKNSKQELLETPLFHLFVDNQQSPAGRNLFLEEKLNEVRLKQVTNFESLCLKNNTPFFAEINLHYLQVKDHYIYQAVVRNISERKKTEQNLVKSKELAEETARAKSHFLSTMSHEIRTPLNGIIGMLNLMLDDYKRPSAPREELETIKYSADNLLHVVDEILDYNKIEAGKITLENKVFSPEKLTANLINIYRPKAQSKGVRLNLELDKNLPEFVIGDEYRNSQILHNLISNALKFTHEGEIILSVKLLTMQDEYCQIEFKVSDTGIGIDENKLKEIFQEFTQTDAAHSRKYGGTGLGLSISKKLVEIQKGKLTVTSCPGKGTTFSYSLFFTLPQQVQTSPLIQETSAEEKFFDNQNVLLVEDNEVNIFVTKKFLEKWNLQVDVAFNGLEAVEKCKNKNYQLILMDLHMPVMDGFEATRLIRKTNSTVPIVGLSADVMTEDPESLIKIGFNDFVSKPFKPDFFFTKISSFLS